MPVPVALEADVLVIGSGLAGMLCALRCAPRGRVALVTKDRLPESSSRYAQGGIASVWGEDDTFESHIDDTLTAGGGLCRRDAVETVVREGPDRVRELIALGVHFDAVEADFVGTGGGVGVRDRLPEGAGTRVVVVGHGD